MVGLLDSEVYLHFLYQDYTHNFHGHALYDHGVWLSWGNSIKNAQEALKATSDPLWTGQGTCVLSFPLMTPTVVKGLGYLETGNFLAFEPPTVYPIEAPHPPLSCLHLFVEQNLDEPFLTSQWDGYVLPTQSCHFTLHEGDISDLLTPQGRHMAETTEQLSVWAFPIGKTSVRIGNWYYDEDGPLELTAEPLHRDNPTQLCTL